MKSTLVKSVGEILLSSSKSDEKLLLSSSKSDEKLLLSSSKSDEKLLFSFSKSDEKLLFSFSKRDCCMCFIEYDMSNMLTPRRCLVRNGLAKSHKICQSCWFSIFAVEDVKHSCPGCPVEYKAEEAVVNPVGEIIDLTEEDE
jgi:hypothetical protein